MSLSPLVDQGIAAYRAGNKEEAIRLLGQAVRENRNDEEAWLYLGAAIDDNEKKIQAFQRVLQINPNNEKAQNALTRLGVAPTAGAAGGPAGAPGQISGSAGGQAVPPAGPTGPSTQEKVVNRLNEGFALPFEVEGSPRILTPPYVIETARMRINQAITIYTKQDYGTYLNAAEHATMWDSVFLVMVGIAVIGIAELLGRIIGWPLGRLFLGIGPLLTAPFAAIIAMVATGVGYAAAVYGSRYYLENQGIKVSIAQHSMYFALIWFPIVLISAVFNFLTNALGLLIVCLAPIFLILGIGLLIYNWILLKGAFDRAYGTDNNRGMITAAIAVIGWWAGSSLVRFILNPIFRL